jgi:hypothetical protein
MAKKRKQGRHLTLKRLVDKMEIVYLCKSVEKNTERQKNNDNNKE